MRRINVFEKNKVKSDVGWLYDLIEGGSILVGGGVLNEGSVAIPLARKTGLALQVSVHGDLRTDVPYLIFDLFSGQDFQITLLERQRQLLAFRSVSYHHNPYENQQEPSSMTSFYVVDDLSLPSIFSAVFGDDLKLISDLCPAEAKRVASIARRVRRQLH
ncbi:hypothetical protein N8000_05250 [Rhodospirillales bacterium]|nr:hypothetical protein [Rhodospirillales bacterium]